MKTVTLLLCIVACGGTVDPPQPAQDASPDVQLPDGAQDAADASTCLQCVAAGWVDTCTQVVQPDPESCLHCGIWCQDN